MNGVIQAVQESEITLTSNIAAIPFNNVDLRTRSATNCCGFINHNNGSALFSILDGGVYRINFNANLTSATPGVVGVALFSDGVQVSGTETDVVVGTAGEFSNVSFNKDVKVCNKGTVNLSINSVPTITYNGGATPVITDTEIPIIKNSNINIERLA